jgi:hypothetical protein
MGTFNDIRRSLGAKQTITGQDVALLLNAVEDALLSVEGNTKKAHARIDGLNKRLSPSEVENTVLPPVTGRRLRHV